MPLKTRRYAFQRFDGGMRPAGSPRDIADNEVDVLENMLPSVYGGAAEVRLGWYAVSTQTPDIAGASWMYYWAYADKYVIVQWTAGTSQNNYTWVLYRIDSDGQNKTQIATTAAGGVPATTHELPQVVSFGYGANNALFIAFGEKIASYTVAGGFVNPHNAACPKASFLVTRFAQLFACGDPDNPSRVHRSDTLDPTDWTTGNGGFYDISAGDGGEVTSIRDHLGDLWIFKGGRNPAIWISRGTAESGYTNVIYESNAPDVYRYSHEATQWGLAFTSRGAIWLLVGTGEQALLMDISKPIKSFAQGKMAAPWLGEGVLAYSRAYDTLFVKIETIGAGYTATSMLMARLIGRQAAWSEYKGPQITCPMSGDVLIGLNVSNNEQLMCYGQDYNQGTPNIIVSDYDTQWRDVAWKLVTKETDFGIEGIRKNPRRVVCDVNVDGSVTGTATVALYVDDSVSTITNVEITAQGGNRDKQKINVVCDTIRAEISGTQAAYGATTDPLSIDWQDADKITRIGMFGWDYRLLRDTSRKQEVP